MPGEVGEDTMVAAAAFSGEEPIELSGNHLADINLHAVESISDLHYASSSHAGAKISEGNSQYPANRPESPHSTATKRFTLPEEDAAFLPAFETAPIIPACTCCPCFNPTCCPTGFFALLGVLVVASLALATLAVYLSVLQSESLRVLSQWLQSQEETIQQMGAVSLQLWSQLNASDSGAQT